MEAFYSRDVIDTVRRARRKADLTGKRLSLHVDGDVYPIEQLEPEGFSVKSDRVPVLRGFVDIYDGARHLWRCLIVRSQDDGPFATYEFKRQTAPGGQPVADYVLDRPEPAGLIEG